VEAGKNTSIVIPASRKKVILMANLSQSNDLSKGSLLCRYKDV
jgi:hypothetical protein